MFHNNRPAFRYLTAFFNSKIFRFTFKGYFPELLGDTRELSKIFFENVRVVPVDDNSDMLFSTLIDMIIDLKEKGEKYQDIEAEIEKRLSVIYSISDDERNLIGSNV